MTRLICSTTASLDCAGKAVVDVTLEVLSDIAMALGSGEKSGGSALATDGRFVTLLSTCATRLSTLDIGRTAVASSKTGYIVIIMKCPLTRKLSLTKQEPGAKTLFETIRS